MKRSRKIIKIFVKKCKNEINKELINIIRIHLAFLVKKGYEIEFFALDKKQLKSIKFNKNYFPMFVINGEKIKGLNEIKEFIKKIKYDRYTNNSRRTYENDNIYANKQRGSLMFDENNENNENNENQEIFKNKQRGSFLFDNDDENQEISYNVNRSRKRDENISNENAKGIEIKNTNRRQNNNSNENKKLSEMSGDKQYDAMLDNMLDNIQETQID